MIIQRLDTPDTLSVHGFLMAVEVEAGTDLEAIGNAVADMLAKHPGVRSWDVEHLGEMEMIEDPEAMKKALGERLDFEEEVDPDFENAMKAKGKN